jgi:hypothetical protein
MTPEQLLGCGVQHQHAVEVTGVAAALLENFATIC